jgi:hypothetical protein
MHTTLIKPHTIRLAGGVFRFPARATFAAAGREDRVAAEMLGAELTHWGCALAEGQAAPTLRFERRAVAGPESYRLRITPRLVTVASPDAAGAYYGAATLKELVRSGRGAAPCGTIEDWPDFARRGVYHDCSRGKVPKLSTLKRLVERLSSWKVNELELYVENVFTFRRHPDIGVGFSPFTPDDILELKRHCHRHHVRLIGSLATLGHMEHVLSLPRYRPLGELPGYRKYPGGTTLCPLDERSWRLVSEMLEEFVPLFDGPDFNVCGDEPWELGKGRSAAKAARVGVGRVYLDFLLKLHRLCGRLGRRTNAWSDIVLEHPDLLKRVPRDMVMLNWEYAPSGGRMSRTKEITRQGLACVVCPGTNAWNSHGCRLRAGMDNIAAFAAEGRRLGAQGLLNTDWGDGGHRNMLAVSLHNLAWGAAAAWNQRACAKATHEEFSREFARHVLAAPAAASATTAAVARNLSVLGGAHEALGLPYANNTVLYNILLPLEGRIPHYDQRVWNQLDGCSDEALLAHGRGLEGLSWSGVSDGVDRGELELAAELDAVACRRAVALRRMRSGRLPSRPQARSLADRTAALTRRLQAAWMLGNRPSRLRDVVAGLRLTQRDYMALL